MRSVEERRIVAFLASGDINASQIADITGIPRSTVREWLAHSAPKHRHVHPMVFDPSSLPAPEYGYLLGFYLGDATISRHRRDVYRLRIFTDARYEGLIGACVAAVRAVMPGNRVLVRKLPSRAVEIGCYSKLWPVYLPQHGPGQKHKRKIELAPWQEAIVSIARARALRCSTLSLARSSNAKRAGLAV
jgi:hypothetical protein